jgi:hypothetical protein
MTGDDSWGVQESNGPVSPLAELPHKTRFHELAHVVLGHTSEADAGLTEPDNADIPVVVSQPDPALHREDHHPIGVERAACRVDS